MNMWRGEKREFLVSRLSLMYADALKGEKLMAKISRRSGMVHGKVGDEVHRGTRHGQVVQKPSIRKVPRSKKELERIKMFSNVGKRFGLLPEGLQARWQIAAGRYSSAHSLCEKRMDHQKTYKGLEIIHHIHSYDGVSFFATCNGWAKKGGLLMPRDFPPMSGIGYPAVAEIIDWRWEKPYIIMRWLIPEQHRHYRAAKDVELAIVSRAAFKGERRQKKGKIIKDIKARDQVVARAKIAKVPSEIELKFDKMYVGPTQGDKLVTLSELGRGRMTICVNVIGAVNRYWGKMPNIPWRKGEPRDVWSVLPQAKVDELRALGKIKDGPLTNAIEDDDFVGGNLCGALMSLDSDYIELAINQEGLPTMRKSSGEYFKELNKGL